jgi:endonuclease YncB( thermonuclease family)
MSKRWRTKGKIVQPVREGPWTIAARYKPARPSGPPVAVSIMLGAVFLGLVAGLAWENWPQQSVAAPSPAIEWNAVAGVPTRTPDAEDLTWQQRAVETDNGVVPASSSASQQTLFGYCHSGGGTNCVVDGDTFWFQGQDIRIADIDTPETHEWHCPAEKELGDKATVRLHELVNSGLVTLQAIDRDEDVYGRKLRLVFVNGASVGETLISEGLAHRYVRGKEPWC